MRILMAACAAFFMSACQTTEAPKPVAECPQYTVPAAPLIAEWSSNGVIFSPLEGAVRSALVAEVNSQEPPTDWSPSDVYVARGGQMAAFVFVFDNGCLWTTGPMPSRNIDAVIRRLEAGAA